LKQDRGSIIEGVLVCPNKQCLSEYPIIDGIPIIVADLRSYVSQNIIPVLRRHDLTDTMEGLLGDCFGPGSAFNSQRQHLSTYCFDHYGDLDPEESIGSTVSPGSVLGVLNQGLSAVPHKVHGPVIDIGCSVGRTAFELARALDEVVLGVDLNFDMLKTAASILDKARLTYPRRCGGIVFDRREFPAVFEGAKNVDFWACDACALPFADASFSFAVSLNVLDCVWSPYDHLKELARILKHEANALISTPYDWTANATPVESWLGGHSQRSENRGSSEMMVRSLLAGGGHPNAIEDLEIVSEEEQIPWTMRLHDRSFMKYPVHLIAVRKLSSAALQS
jgi:SAM-dependent methyltransferase